MSRVFNDTSTLEGLVQMYELEIGANLGDVSGNTSKLQRFTALTRGAFDSFFAIALPASGTWQLDDSNQTDYPIIKTNIISGQRDYSFTVDASSNLILDIYKVAILQSAAATDYIEIKPVDTQSGKGLATTFNATTTGIPSSYDKTANGIFFDIIPNYAATSGLLLYINREAPYFVYTDTTKKPGVPGLFHDYFYLKPAMEYARRNNLANYKNIQLAVFTMEQAIGAYFGERRRDEPNRITVASHDNR